MKYHTPKTKPVAPLDRETVFQLVSIKDWKRVINLFKENANYTFICNDVVLKPFIDQYFVNELLSGDAIKSDPAYKYYLQEFYIMHKSPSHGFKLSEEDFKKLILKIVEVDTILESAYKFAQIFPEEEICKQVIQKVEQSRPQVVNHTQADTIRITTNKNIKSRDARISLFKSRQEYNFYVAVRNVFPNFHVYPNVAMSAIIDFEAIREELDTEERNYFFKSLIDCVVVDAEDNFRPVRFIELDSFYHDSESGRRRDFYKDNILAAAGQKLIRIRQVAFNEEGNNFEKLIREAIK